MKRTYGEILTVDRATASLAATVLRTGLSQTTTAAARGPSVGHLVDQLRLIGTLSSIALMACSIGCPSSVSAQTATTNFSRSDRYAGCIFSYAIPLMHNGVKLSPASAIAFKKCSSASKGIGENGLEGLSDYVNMILEKVSK